MSPSPVFTGLVRTTHLREGKSRGGGASGGTEDDGARVDADGGGGMSTDAFERCCFFSSATSGICLRLNTLCL